MSILRAASSISAGTLVSRLLGLCRDVLMLQLLGVTWATGSFVLAWMFPNMLRRLFGEGALSASFVPAFSATLDRDGKAAARRLLGTTTGALLVILGAICLIVTLSCFVLPPAALGLPDGDGVTTRERGELLLRLTAILFPYCVPICLAAIYSGALNALGVFWVPSVAPALLNVFWIAGAVHAARVYEGDPAAIATLMATWIMAGGVVQLATTAWPLWRRGYFALPAWPAAGDPARRVFKAMVPTALGLSIVQMNLLVDQTLAEYLVGPGANAHIYNANRLLLFPHALTALALATAAFPRFAVLASRADREALRAKVQQTMYWTLFLTVPATAGLIAVAPDFIQLLYVHGNFTADDGAVSARTTMLLVAGLPFLGIAQLYARALYALGDARTPAKVSAALLFVNVGLNLLFVLGLRLGVAGFTLATTCSSLVNALALHRVFQMRCPGPAGRLAPHLRVVAATLLMVVVVVLARQAIAERWPALHGGAARFGLYLGVPIALGVVTYFAGNLAIGGRAALRR